MAIEEAAYPVTASDGAFERLFRYISGGNRSREKIATTVPVATTAD